MICVLIVDDEKPARKRLQRLLGAYEDIEIIGEAENGLEALTKIAQLSPDLVFLDIQMPELDGLGVAQAIPSNGPRIVFATAYDQYALDAFDAAAMDYLVKPISTERLGQSIERYRASKNTNVSQFAEILEKLKGHRTSNRIPMKSGATYVVLDPKEIVAIQAEDHYAVVKGPKKEILCDDSLDALVSRLPQETFLRVHRSAIINLDRIESLVREGERKYFAIMQGKEPLRIPISRERLSGVKQALRIL